MTDYQRLKMVRKLLNYNQKDFAELLDIQQGSYSDIERGRIAISYNILKKLASNFIIDPMWIMTGQGDKFISKVERTSNIEKIILKSLVEGDIEKGRAIGYFDSIAGSQLSIITAMFKDELQELYNACSDLSEIMRKWPHPMKDDYYYSKFKERPVFENYFKEVNEEFENDHPDIEDKRSKNILFIMLLENLINHFIRDLIRQVSYIKYFNNDLNTLDKRDDSK
jgi:transcriptional regulator with XRE-family HTH domain